MNSRRGKKQQAEVFSQNMLRFLIGGYWDTWAVNPDGSVEWREKVKNGVTNAGLNDVLGVYLAGGTQKTTWYIGLITQTAFSALSANDTMASHAGWSEDGNYAESVRQTWTPGAVASQSVTNPTPASFTAASAMNLNGLFLVSNNTIIGSTGTLWATGSFSSSRSLTTGQVFKASYTCGAAGA